ncbi:MULTISPECIES: amphi-Trp domain-containing protein [Halolamina]|uniref:Amphi-Trp domain-containing protein n=1 Tax=Halolamina pelagica TaxID=699431 RepID=A0A1I5R7X9_9EURY|nr:MULTISPECIES: amphi-Trp domain-containing protein [Halolamina]NHX35724.1 amphi-Trp domain-containing protein [Halolamina sp. R1-12]SFP54510.1 amphi-Trp domain-containing protein [Halolamina pelagica]
MPEDVLFKTESSQDRSEIADYLRRVADSLEGGGELSLRAGTESVTVDPPERPTLEVKVEREGPADQPEKSVEFEIEWTEGEGGGEGDGDLRID